MAKQDDRPTLDLATLSRGLLQDLAEAAGATIDPRRRAESGRAQLAAAGERIQADRDASLDTAATAYQDRAADLQDVLAQRRRRLEAYAGRERRVVPAVKGRFVVAGHVTDQATGGGLPNLRVRATDLDRKHHELLGEVRTDAMGYYRIEYTPAQFADRGEGMPEVYIEVLDDAGAVIFTSPRSFIMKSGEAEFIAADVDGAKVPASRALGGKVQGTVERRLANLDRRVQTLARPAGEFLRELPLRAADAAAGAPPVAVKEPSGVALVAVKGIGEALAKRLEARGIRDAGAVAELEPDRLGEILNVGRTKAAAMIKDARRLVRKRP